MWEQKNSIKPSLALLRVRGKFGVLILDREATLYSKYPSLSNCVSVRLSINGVRSGWNGIFLAAIQDRTLNFFHVSILMREKLYLQFEVLFYEFPD